MDSVNRALWIVLAVLLTAAGILGSVASLGGLPGAEPQTPLLSDALLRRWREYGDVAPWSLAALGVVLALLGAALVRSQLRRRGGPGLSDLTLDRGIDPGTTTVAAGALSGGLERDLATLPHVQRAGVRLIGEPERLRVQVRLQVRPWTDLETLGHAVDARLERFARTSGLQPDDVDVTVAVEANAAARVH